MQSEPTITFKNIGHSDAIERQVMERIVDLEKYHPRIVSCDVVIDRPQKRKVSGELFEVHVNVTVPGSDVHTSRALGRSEAAEDLSLAIHQAFDAARRLLQDQDRQMDVHRHKAHAPVEHGEVDRLFEGEGYGFIKTAGGEEFYFSRESLTSDFWTHLRVGSKLKFRAEDGENGPYAANVTQAD